MQDSGIHFAQAQPGISHQSGTMMSQSGATQPRPGPAQHPQPPPITAHTFASRYSAQFQQQTQQQSQQQSLPVQDSAALAHFTTLCQRFEQNKEKTRKFMYLQVDEMMDHLFVRLRFHLLNEMGDIFVAQQVHGYSPTIRPGDKEVQMEGVDQMKQRMMERQMRMQQMQQNGLNQQTQNPQLNQQQRQEAHNSLQHQQNQQQNLHNQQIQQKLLLQQQQRLQLQQQQQNQHQQLQQSQNNNRSNVSHNNNNQSCSPNFVPPPNVTVQRSTPIPGSSVSTQQPSQQPQQNQQLQQQFYQQGDVRAQLAQQLLHQQRARQQQQLQQNPQRFFAPGSVNGGFNNSQQIQQQQPTLQQILAQPSQQNQQPQQLQQDQQHTQMQQQTVTHYLCTYPDCKFYNKHRVRTAMHIGLNHFGMEYSQLGLPEPPYPVDVNKYIRTEITQRNVQVPISNPQVQPNLHVQAQAQAQAKAQVEAQTQAQFPVQPQEQIQTQAQTQVLAQSPLNSPSTSQFPIQVTTFQTVPTLQTTVPLRTQVMVIRPNVPVGASIRAPPPAYSQIQLQLQQPQQPVFNQSLQNLQIITQSAGLTNRSPISCQIPIILQQNAQPQLTSPASDSALMQNPSPNHHLVRSSSTQSAPESSTSTTPPVPNGPNKRKNAPFPTTLEELLSRPIAPTSNSLFSMDSATITSLTPPATASSASATPSPRRSRSSSSNSNGTVNQVPPQPKSAPVEVPIGTQNPAGTEKPVDTQNPTESFPQSSTASVIRPLAQCDDNSFVDPFISPPSVIFVPQHETLVENPTENLSGNSTENESNPKVPGTFLDSDIMPPPSVMIIEQHEEEEEHAYGPMDMVDPNLVIPTVESSVPEMNLPESSFPESFFPESSLPEPNLPVSVVPETFQPDNDYISPRSVMFIPQPESDDQQHQQYQFENESSNPTEAIPYGESLDQSSIAPEDQNPIAQEEEVENPIVQNQEYFQPEPDSSDHAQNSAFQHEFVAADPQFVSEEDMEYCDCGECQNSVAAMQNQNAGMVKEEEEGVEEQIEQQVEEQFEEQMEEPVEEQVDEAAVESDSDSIQFLEEVEPNYLNQNPPAPNLDQVGFPPLKRLKTEANDDNQDSSAISESVESVPNGSIAPNDPLPNAQSPELSNQTQPSKVHLPPPESSIPGIQDKSSYIKTATCTKVVPNGTFPVTIPNGSQEMLSIRDRLRTMVSTDQHRVQTEQKTSKQSNKQLKTNHSKMVNHERRQQLEQQQQQERRETPKVPESAKQTNKQPQTAEQSNKERQSTEQRYDQQVPSTVEKSNNKERRQSVEPSKVGHSNSIQNNERRQSVEQGSKERRNVEKEKSNGEQRKEGQSILKNKERQSVEKSSNKRQSTEQRHEQQPSTVEKNDKERRKSVEKSKERQSTENRSRESSRPESSRPDSSRQAEKQIKELPKQSKPLESSERRRSASSSTSLSQSEPPKANNHKQPKQPEKPVSSVPQPPSRRTSTTTAAVAESDINSTSDVTQGIKRKQPEQPNAQQPSTSSSSSSNKDFFTTISQKCSVVKCAQYFANKVELNEHHAKVHQLEQHMCYQKGCGQSFKNRKRFQVHLEESHPKGTKWRCGQCDILAKDYNRLDIHMKWNHLGGKFKCVKCEYIDNYLIDLNRHSKAVHGEEVGVTGSGNGGGAGSSAGAVQTSSSTTSMNGHK